MNIIKKRTVWYVFSLVLIAASITCISIWGIQPGTDFTGGTLIEIGFNKKVEADTVRQALKDLDLQSLSISETGKKSVIIKTSTLKEGEIDEIFSTLKTNLTSNKETGITEVKEQQIQVIGPTIGKDLTKRALIAVTIAIFAIILYVAWSFRRVQKPFSSWSMSSATIAALIHDMIIVIGFVCVINHFYGFEADSYLLVALLTVLGFSVHDTIVVFDRIRENILHSPKHKDVAIIVNDSINQTITRSLNTSLTAILVLLALATIGGGTIRSFSLILLAGIAIGTYSSIFVAAPLLVSWSKFKEKRSSHNK